MVAVVIPVYDRLKYLYRCLESLREAITEQEIAVVFINDASEDENVVPMLNQFCYSLPFNMSAKVLSNAKNEGVKYSLRRGIAFAFQEDAEMVIILESDTIVKPEFIDVLLSIHLAHNDNGIVSGFNWTSPRNPVIKQEKGIVYKNSCCGVNMCFNKEQYHQYVEPALLGAGDWDFHVSLNHFKDNKLFAISSPSVVQHVGKDSSMGHPDFIEASDY